MLTSKQIDIPEEHKPWLKELIELPEASAQQLLDALKSANPTLSPESLASQIAPNVHISAERVRGIVLVLVSLSATCYYFDVPAEKWVEDVIRAAGEAGLQLGDESEVEAVRKRLNAFLSVDNSLGVTSRAAYILAQHKNPFISARILTDMRPVYTGGNDPVPRAGMIVHTLELISSTDNRKLSHFIAMDSRDLRILRGVVERAILKEASLREAIARTDLYFIDVEQD
jgi:hypothetical protein